MSAPCREHNYGSGERCLKCSRRRPNPGPEYPTLPEIDEALSARPGVRTRYDPDGHAASVDDPAGWGEDGNPWG